MRWVRMACAAVACLVVLIAAGCAGTTGATSGSDDGFDLPDLTLTGVPAGGTSADLDLRETGRDRVLNLWAIWCAPCREELPVFDEVAALAESNRGPEIIGINVGDSLADAQSLVDELGLTFRQVLDPRSQVRTDLRITGMPATIFVSSTGEVIAIHNGEVDRGELIDLVNKHFDAGLT